MKLIFRPAIAIVLLAAACRSTQHDEPATSGRWQVIADQAGHAVLTDTATGDTWISQNDHGTYRWQPILPAAAVTTGEHVESTPTASEQVLTLDRAVWWDDPTWSPNVREMLKSKPMLLLHVANSPDYSTVKPFTQRADMDFSLQERGHPKLALSGGTGGVTVGPEVYIVLSIQSAELEALQSGEEYTLKPANSRPGFRWQVAHDLKIVRR
jgi:hypothetical protein